MSFSKVNKPFKKPLGWWWFKIKAEIGWHLIDSTSWGWTLYYKSTRKMIDEYGFNIHGDRM